MIHFRPKDALASLITNAFSTDDLPCEYRRSSSQVDARVEPSTPDTPTASLALSPCEPGSGWAVRYGNAHTAFSNATVRVRRHVITMGVAQSQIQRPGLYLAVLGGRTPQTHVELHDVRWVVGCCIDDTIPELKRQWFGHRKGLHLDSYVRIDCVDGYAVKLRQNKSSDVASEGVQAPLQKLWFVNMGGYDASSLLELHQVGCVVAPNAQAAKSRARKRWLTNSLQQHKDDLHAIDQVGGVDDCLPIDELQGWQVTLTPAPDQPCCNF